MFTVCCFFFNLFFYFKVVIKTNNGGDDNDEVSALRTNLIMLIKIESPKLSCVTCPQIGNLMLWYYRDT